ncbi:unnamed protein product [Lactuca saligna]|uniref:J domain-containing protein n=1 Tax=Lactuca saligna TaxID=75948 RepID=A0AA36DZ87_LACSI|nr:unnamed protein product [Lactuca saligna]
MKGYRDNGGAAGGFGARNKTVYDDVFGGPPKFGATTLPPRLEDYTEIFQGFHASRGSSIPILDLPPPCNESDDVWFDLQSSKLDYSEVFGGFNGLDFAVSYEELFKISKVGDGDSSDDVWTPAESETLSDELDPYASMEMNQHVSTEDPIGLFGVQLQSEPNFEEEKDLIINDSQFLDVPNEIENEKLFSLANNYNDDSSSNHFGGVSERKQLKKSLSQPLDNVYDTERYKPHLSVSDLSLKTQPSNLPPPSRPPPVLSSKKGNSKLKTSKTFAFEKMRGDRSPPYFDVEIDASSSAAADAAAMKDAVEQAQAKLRNAKELMNKKKEALQIHSKNNVADKKERVNGDERERERERHNKKISLESSYEQKEDFDFKNVEEREVFNGLNEEDEHIKEDTLSHNNITCKQNEEEIKTSEADESELYDNLIEIQLKDNDMKPGVKLVEEFYNKTPDEWEDYNIAAFQEAFEKEHKKELKESEEQVGPPEEEDHDHESEEEKILHEEDEIITEETQNADVALKNETIHETKEGSEEMVSENDVIEKEEELTEEVESNIKEISDVVDQVDDELTSVSKNEATLNNPINNMQNVKETSIEKNDEKNKEREKLERERERMRKEEEERERQIEREKDRMAIDRATLEERERAFSETKERSERAAVERATAEYRQRALAEARERLEKACAEARERSLAEKTMEGRLRVEKATAEARERAEKSVDDKFSNSRSMGLRYSTQNASSYNGGESESPQRCKARLERHQRTADRAAKALAEKNMRDLLAQKEQAERNRLAESLDAEVKRWCSGKQGNLRALLSTLQYILGSESGWQPIPLTEVITTAAVKKAYRKATLCVHPDKLQQRGASIQQKYVCEKVFDLLKEAWNKFNSEER